MRLSRYIFIFTLVLITSNAFAQVELKKKQAKERIETLTELTDLKVYENALMVYYDTTVSINRDKLPKKYLEELNRLDGILELKKLEFENNIRRVDEFISDYKNNRFCNSLGLIRMNLNKENSYSRTRSLKDSFYRIITPMKEKVDKNASELDKWEREYEEEGRESLFFILSKDIGFIRYLCNDKRKKYSDLVVKLRADKRHYDQVKNYLVSQPEKKVRLLKYSDLTYERSLQLIDELSEILDKSDSCFNALKGENLELKLNFETVEKQIEKELPKLKKFAVENVPMSEDEVFTMFTSSDSFKLYQLRKFSTPLSGELRLLPLYKLDVFGYYGIPFDNKKEKEDYMLTEEYQEKFTELKKIKEEALNTFYYFTVSMNDNRVNYNKETGLLTLTLGSNVGNSTRRAVTPGTINGIGFKSLPLKKSRIKKYGKEAFTQRYQIQLDSAGIETMRSNSSGIELYFNFRILEKENVKFRYFVKGDAWHTIRSGTHNTQNVTVLLANSSTNEIIYRKIYLPNSN
jgi:hypothetical protein